MRKSRRIRLVGLVMVLMLGAGAVYAEDWPMWRYDANRSAASPVGLPEDLHLRWVVQYTPRTMVWDDPLNQDMMHYDRVFEPVVLGDTLYLGFNDVDKLVALDTDTGEERWAFYVDGPVRLPPVASDKRVYFVSDEMVEFLVINGSDIDL